VFFRAVKTLLEIEKVTDPNRKQVLLPLRGIRMSAQQFLSDLLDYQASPRMRVKKAASDGGYSLDGKAI
jgi:hypothetical protein